jgi:hypothetical protein
MTLRKGIWKSARKMRPQSVRFAGKLNPIMQEVLSNKKIAKALDQPRERKEFFGMLKSVSKEGVYKSELRKLFGDLRSGKVRSRTINAKELRVIAKEIFPDSARRYDFSGPKPSENKSQDTLQNGSSKRAGFRTMKASSKKSSFRTTGRNSEPKNDTAPTNETPTAPTRITAIKSQPTKQYAPGSSLDFEFAKPGFQSTERPAMKKEVEIKPVAPEDYTKIPGTSQATTDVGEIGIIPDKSGNSIPNSEDISSLPKEKKQKAANQLSPEDKEKLAFPKATLSGSADLAANGKPSLVESESGISSVNDISASKAIKTEALLKSARREMLAAREGERSKKTKRGFFGSIAATEKNKAKSQI